jgi:hypothetical protein
MGWACVPPIAEGLAVCEVPHDTPRLILREQVGGSAGRPAGVQAARLW